MLVSGGRNGQLVRGTDLEKERDSSITVRVENAWKMRSRTDCWHDVRASRRSKLLASACLNYPRRSPHWNAKIRLNRPGASGTQSRVPSPGLRKPRSMLLLG